MHVEYGGYSLNWTTQRSMSLNEDDLPETHFGHGLFYVPKIFQTWRPSPKSFGM